MTTPACRVTLALTRVWLSLYTLGLPADVAADRREEIESDLWEMQHDPSVGGSQSLVFLALRRLVAGMAADIAWRMEVAPGGELVTNSAGHRRPSFHVIETRRPSPGSVAAGMLTSTLMFAGFGLMLDPREFVQPLLEVTEGQGSELPGTDAGEALDPASAPAAVSGTRDQLIASTARLIKQHFFDPAIGWQLATAVLVHQTDGHYDTAATWPEVVDRLNRHIYEAGQMAGMPPGTFVADVVYSEDLLAAGPASMRTAEIRHERQQAVLRQNCLVERAETLPRNIGYLKVNGFPDPAVCTATANQAMAALNGVDALIVDLRDNGGGMGELAVHLAGHFFDRPRFFYDPRESSRVAQFTTSPVTKSTVVDTPLYVLTSSRTQSAAEYFVYNMRMAKRATIVGERTAGEQHSGRFYRINDHFGIAIQSTPPPQNPFSIKGWERIGIVPDIVVPSADALETATKLAVSASATK